MGQYPEVACEGYKSSCFLLRKKQSDFIWMSLILRGPVRPQMRTPVLILEIFVIYLDGKILRLVFDP